MAAVVVATFVAVIGLVVASLVVPSFVALVAVLGLVVAPLVAVAVVLAPLAVATFVALIGLVVASFVALVAVVGLVVAPLVAVAVVLVAVVVIGSLVGSLVPVAIVLVAVTEFAATWPVLLVSAAVEVLTVTVGQFEESALVLTAPAVDPLSSWLSASGHPGAGGGFGLLLAVLPLTVGQPLLELVTLA